jgi:hypothetical protein
MKTEYYQTPGSSLLMRAFWKAAGGDRYILEKATYGDQIKYMCLGGIVLTTGVMAGLAGGYAFYTIFEPRGIALDNDLSISTAIMSIAFGIIWGLIIFNIDRFIVTSTGKGDGTEAITMEEFKTAIPRIIMGTIIALTISKPVEIRMFKSEIDTEIHTRQMALKEQYILEADSLFEPRINRINNEIENLNNEIQAQTERSVELEDQYIEEARIITVGPRARAIKEQWDRAKGEEMLMKKTYAPIIAQARSELDSIYVSKRKVISESQQKAENLDGLLEKILVSHELSGWIGVFVTLLFLAIELTPIFFKLMLIKTPYDYVEENIKELMKAEQGVYVIRDYFQDNVGRERDLTKHINAEKIISEKIELQAVQERLTQYALSKYEAKMKKEIDAAPEAFIEQSTNA